MDSVNAAGKLIRSIAFAVSRTWLNIILLLRVRSWNWIAPRLGPGTGTGPGLGLVFQFNRFKVTRNAAQFIDRPRAGPHWESERAVPVFSSIPGALPLLKSPSLSLFLSSFSGRVIDVRDLNAIDKRVEQLRANLSPKPDNAHARLTVKEQRHMSQPQYTHSRCQFRSPSQSWSQSWSLSQFVH